MDLTDLTSTIAGTCLDFVADAPMIYHCHHFNLFLDQTVDDALGPDLSRQVRHDAARAACRQLIANVCDHAGAQTPAERLEIAGGLFGAFGHGRLDLDVDAAGGTAGGTHLHYGFAWREKYGAQVRRTTPADGVASGWAAAAAEIALRTDTAFRATESACLAKRDDRCAFALAPDPNPAQIPTVTRATTTANAPVAGLAEERIAAIEAGLRSFLAGVSGDARGLIEAFGVLITRHLPNYYNAISYRALASARGRDAALVPVVESLLRESGHVCVFNTIGGILYSPEWDALVGRIEGDLVEVVSSGAAISRALGFGAWSIEALDRDRLVLVTGSEYESPFCLLSEECPREANAYFRAGRRAGADALVGGDRLAGSPGPRSGAVRPPVPIGAKVAGRADRQHRGRRSGVPGGRGACLTPIPPSRGTAGASAICCGGSRVGGTRPSRG